MRILLFGGSGQLGHELCKRARDLNFEIISPVWTEINIAEKQQVRFLAEQVKPELIINAAAYTAVDKAETDRDEAFRINAEGAANVAEVAKGVNAPLIYISTDYVFPGTGDRPLVESDPTGPLNVYGESKLAGEKEVQRVYGERSAIVRTSSLHGQCGINFVHTMLELFKSKPSLKIVSDQYMSPTWAGWLAEVVLDLGRISWHGVMHASCAGVTTWIDFAAEIQRLASFEFPQVANVSLEAITAEQFGRPAKRPMYSAFDCSLLAQVVGRKPIPWQEGLRNHLQDLGMKLE